MKILLINPFLTSFANDPVGVSSTSGLEYLAAHLRKTTNIMKNKSEESLLRRKRENYRNQRKVIALLKKFASSKKPDLSLEVGCGDGYFSELISDFSKEVVATDIEKKIAGSVLRKKNIMFQIADGTNLPFEDRKFDLVFSIDVIEHVKDDQKFIDENLRVLKSGGLLITVTPNKRRLVNSIFALFGFSRHYPLFLGCDFTGRKVVHIREYARDGLLSLINKSRFKTKNYKVIGCYLGISGNFGFVNCPVIFEKWCGSWVLAVERA